MAQRQFDVFLSYSSADGDAASRLAEKLRDEKVSVWLDKWDINAGDRFLRLLERGLRSSKCYAVLLGANNQLGRFQELEADAAIIVATERKGMPIIPVYLPGADPEDSSVPVFLKVYSSVVFHESLDEEEPFAALMAGIRKKKATAGLGVSNPYPGLRAFEIVDAPLFFGRGRLTELALRRMESFNVSGPRWLTFVGDSGCGKSSLAKAGVCAALHEGRLEGSDHWPLVILQPDLIQSGVPSIEALVIHVAEALSLSAAATAQFRNDVSGGPDALHLAVHRALFNEPRKRLVILVDQFEQFFSSKFSETDVKAFVEGLQRAAMSDGGKTVVLMTLRPDFYKDCFRLPGMPAILDKTLFSVEPMSEHELEEVIREPARQAGVAVDTGEFGSLVAHLLGDVRAQPECLPMLEYALWDLWTRTDGQPSLAKYLEAGGLSGLLRAKAEAAFEEVKQHAGVCEWLFRLLAEPIGRGRYVKHRRGRAEISSRHYRDEDILKVIDAFADASTRLLILSVTPGKQDQSVEIAHDALTGAWPRLRKWLTSSENFAELRRYMDAQRADPKAVLQGSWLTHALAELQRTPALFIASEEDLIRRSVRARRIRKAVPIAGAVATALLIAATGFALREERIARSREKAAESSERLFDGRSRKEAIQSAREALALWPTVEAQEALHEAVQSMEPWIDHSAESIGWRADGRLLAVGQQGSTVRTLGSEDGDGLDSTSLGTGAVTAVAFGGAGWLSAGDDRGAAKLWRVGDRGKLTLSNCEISNVGPVAGILFRPHEDPRELFVAAGSRIQVFRLPEQTAQSDGAAKPCDSLGSIDASEDLRAVALSADGSTLAAALREKRILLWRWTERRWSNLGSISWGNAQLRDVVLSPKGDAVYAAALDGNLGYWRVANQDQHVQIFVDHQGIRALAMDPAGELLVTVGVSGRVRLWEIPAVVPLISLRARRYGKPDEIASGLKVAFGPSRLLAVATNDEKVRCYSVERQMLVNRARIAAEKGTLKGCGALP